MMATEHTNEKAIPVTTQEPLPSLFQRVGELSKLLEKGFPEHWSKQTQRAGEAILRSNRGEEGAAENA